MGYSPQTHRYVTKYLQEWLEVELELSELAMTTLHTSVLIVVPWNVIGIDQD